MGQKSEYAIEAVAMELTTEGIKKERKVEES